MRLKTICITVVVCFSLGCISCGPETIRLRPSIDSPAHHTENGYKLMAYGKVDAAIREFERAKELKPSYAPAYVGLGIAVGLKGDLETGRAWMRQAQKLARDREELKEVQMGFERLDYIEKENQEGSRTGAREP